MNSGSDVFIGGGGGRFGWLRRSGEKKGQWQVGFGGDTIASTASGRCARGWWRHRVDGVSPAMAAVKGGEKEGGSSVVVRLTGSVAVLVHRRRGEAPLDVRKIKSKETDHHSHKANTLSNVDVGGFGGIGGGGGGGGGGFGIGIGIGGRGRGGGFGLGIYGGIPVYNVPGYGSPIYIPGLSFPVYPRGCGYVCPANNPTGEITALKISGLSHSTRPYRCRPGPNMAVNKDSNSELLLHFVDTVQDKHEHPRYGKHSEEVGLRVGGGRRLGFGRGNGRGTDDIDTSEYNRYGFNPGLSCGYLCPRNSPYGGITDFHISGLSNFNGPYRCRPDMCDDVDCHEVLLHFVPLKHDKHESQHDHPVERSEEREAGRRSEQREEEIIN
ncbi:hypothetical protein CQW23_04429 [Capsicum baccatum]|uniref:Uncharacterized protein n=1 Tax=Capsicum baccatum TaxID=33114 RepID=A0A2G2XEL6_CAPBA|nr:hypothetical protein CQW23_04429 [Capsicum baccatum]